MKRIRAVAIAVNSGKVSLIHRMSHGKEYYVFPGGGETLRLRSGQEAMAGREFLYFPPSFSSGPSVGQL